MNKFRKTAIAILTIILAALAGCSASLHVQRSGETYDAGFNITEKHTHAVNQLPAVEGL